MYDEPYRWVEAVSNRRQYLDDQLSQGSPVVALSYPDGILFFTFSQGTPKLYEIYDRIGLGGMGHPADLEKLRFTILDMAHLEGFQRSPSDVTGARLVKYGLAPVIKQAFEEIFKAPYICKILLGEMGEGPNQDRYVTINYDGTFEERLNCAVLGGTTEIEKGMLECMKGFPVKEIQSLSGIIKLAAKAWATGSLMQRRAHTHPDEESGEEMPSGTSRQTPYSEETLQECLRATLEEKTMECAILERNIPGSSKYRTLTLDEIHSVLPEFFTTSKP